MIIGILVSEFLHLSLFGSCIGLCLSILGSLIFYFKKETSFRRQSMVGAFLMTAIVFLGAGIARLDQGKKPPRPIPESWDSRYLLLVEKELKPTENSCRYEVRVRSINHGKEWTVEDLGAILYIKKEIDPVLIPGERILVSGNLLQIPAPMNPFEFDLQDFYLRKGITHRIFIDEGGPLVLKYSKDLWLQRKAAEARNWIEEKYLKHVNPNNLGVLMGMALGQKNTIDKETTDAFRRSGASHLLAVSGLHMGIIYLIIIFLIPRNEGKLKWLRSLLVILIMFAYAFISGLPASALRAGIMLSLIEIGNSLGRKHTNWNALGLSAFLLLVYDHNLIWDIGFQLSFSAMAGIFLFYRPLTNIYISYLPVFGWIWRSLALTLSVLATTSPLILFYFGKFQIYGLLTNLFSGIAALFILSLFSASLMVSFISETLFKYLSILLDGLIGIFTAILNAFSSLPYSDISVTGFDLLVLFASLMLVLSIAGFLNEKRPAFLLLCQALLAFLIGYNSFKEFNAQNTKELALFPTSQGSILTYSNGDNSVVIPEKKSISKTTIDWSLSGYFKKIACDKTEIIQNPKPGANIRFDLGETRVLFMDNPYPSEINSADLIHISCLPKKEKLVMLNEYSGLIILAQDFPEKRKLVSYLNESQIKFRDLAEGYILEYL